METAATYQSDDPADALPAEDRQSPEEYKEFLLRKHGLLTDENLLQPS